MSNRKAENFDELQERVDKLYAGFDLLLYDYHSRFHKDDGDRTGHRFCIEWPCLQFQLQIFK